MKKLLLRKVTLSAFFIAFSIGLMAQSTTHVDGKITDNNGDPMVGANILVKGQVIGTVADIDGNYSLDVRSAPPLTLIVSMIGYASQEIEITDANTKGMDIKMDEQALLGQEVVVSASRMEESILESPVTVEKMGINAIKNTASATFYDGIANLKGVQMTASSMTFKSINTRGFATMANTRFVQLIDGMDNSAPGLNFPMGNMVGIGELDIESVELVPGAASALYGPNAFNGILLMNSKNPFDYQGLSVSAKAGVTQQEAAGTNGYYDFNLRYAKAFNNKFAFKVNFSYLTAQDWWAADYSQHAEEEPGQFNTNYNGINIYGDAVATTLNFDAIASDFGINAPPGTFGAEKIARTGYQEVDLIDYNTESIKGSVGLNYRLSDKMELSYDYRFGKGTAIYQGFSRYSLNNLSLQQHKIELRGDNFFVRAYGTFENAGDSYDSRFAAWNINRGWKADTDWFAQYAGAYVTGIAGILGTGNLPTDAQKQAVHDAARGVADTGRLVPGTQAFEDEKKRVTELADLATGAKFLDESKMYHAEGSFNFKNQISFLDLVVGAHFRQYNLNSFGTIFNDRPVEDGGNGPISINEYGGYAQASKRVANDRLKLGASIRYDKNENFDGQISPRAFAVMSVDSDRKHNIRASYQTGFRNPDTQSQFIALDLGPATLVGGTQKNLDMYSKTTNFGGISGSTLYDNAYTASSAAAFGAAFPGYVTEAFVNGAPDLPTAQAMALAAHADELIVAENKLIEPEQVTSIELGYKGVFNNKFMIDVNFYRSEYTNFQLINTVVVIPDAAGDVNDLTTFTGAQAFLGMASLGETEAYQLYTNIADPVTSSGFGIGLNYLLPGGYDLGGSYNYADFSLDTQSNPDNIPGFNTPKNRYNIQFSNREVFDNFGFSASYRWSDKYDWTGTFGNGPVAAFSSLDMQVSYNITGMRSVVKLGANNILGTEFVQAYGAPAIGSTYYLSLTFDEMFRK
ncbi:MAG: TonB-dependent receptor [Cyclobacteriaceae bacterium]|nr:TonB-dependent receptor [Cyclobacteriaceae bacterium]